MYLTPYKIELNHNKFKMKELKIALLLLVTTICSAQKSFFETLESHGSDAVYQRYYSVYKDDAGIQKIEGKQYRLKAEILKFEGIYSGVKLEGASDEDKAGIMTLDLVKSKSSQFIGYPNVSMVVDRISRKGFIAIDDFIFKVGSVWKEKDGIGFNDINEIYIRVGAAGNASKTKDGKKKKKKKFGAFLNKVKNAAVNKPQSECTSPGCKKAEGIDLVKFVRAYLKDMESKQKSYALTAKDKADIQTLKKAVDGYYEYVKTKNDSYWKSAEGQAILKNRETVKKVEAEHMKYCRLSKEDCGAVMHKSY